MKHLLLAFLILLSTSIFAAETIVIASPYSASHSGTPAMQKIVATANQMQRRYNFILEFKPGGEQIIAIKYLDEQPNSRLAIIAPKFVEHSAAGRLKKDDYVPIHALGDACWAVISNTSNTQQGINSLQGLKELVVGGVGVGNAAHLTSLELGDRYEFEVTYVPFKSNFDALILLISNQGINMVLERVASFQQYREKNPNINVLAMSCPKRHPDLPRIATLAEQGIESPYVFNITVAHQNMPTPKRIEIANILNEATRQVGPQEIFRLSDMTPPMFSNILLSEYYKQRYDFMLKLLKKHQNKIQNN
jgi:tripartite-type tricarboxylate transporter receptor subunit TctC